MAVTDLSDGLPYWARQGQGYGGGPGPTGGPAAAPQGGPGSAAWLQYLTQMFGPDAAQAAELAPPTNGGQEQQAPNAGNIYAAAAAAPPPAPAGPSILPQARGVAVPPGPPPGPPMGPPQSPTPWFTGSNTPMPWRPNPNAPAPAAQPVAMAPSAANPLAAAGGGGATAMGASANPRFVGIPAPNASPQNSMRGGPQGTALNLAGLFGGGGLPNPNAPAANAQPVSGRVAGPMAQGGAPSGDNWDIDQDGNVVPNYGPGSTKPKRAADPSAARARILRPDLYG